MTRIGRDELRGRAQTVTGLVDPAALGPTLMHEHLIWDVRTPAMIATGDDGPEIELCNCFRINYGRRIVPGNLVSRSVDVACREVAAMVEAGGRTVVELTCGGLKPDPEGLVRVSRETGALIVMGCGHYVDDYQDRANEARSVESFAAEMVSQVFEGAWDTGIRAGIIGEIGCQAPWTDQERRVMRGALMAQAETGATVNVHPGRDADQPQEVAEFIRAAGGDMGRVVISHIDRTIFDTDRLLRLADTGVALEFDLFGTEAAYYPLNTRIDMPNDGTRLKMIRALIDHGHLPRIVISHDICTRTRLSSFGGHGYGHIFANVLPMMRRRGFSNAEIDAIMVGNPARLLTIV